jgi:hypothetical protein
MRTTRKFPGYVEIAPGKFVAADKLTVGQLRRALVTEHVAGQDKRFRDLLWLRRQIAADAKDSDPALVCAGVVVSR